jgi:DNA-binding LacI/PurR family transcriptional regulator
MSESAHTGNAPASGRSRPPASTDVARLAGVSQKTVSRVMNGEPHVTNDVRRRVTQAAQELGYRRNNAARALNSGRTHRIGFVSLGSAWYGPATLLTALERATRSAGYSLSVVNTFEGDPGGIAGAINALLEQGVDGIVLSEPIDEGEDLPFDVDLPALSVGRRLNGSRVVVTGIDSIQCGRMATEHLLALGHHTVWHVAGPKRWWGGRERLQGWRDALRAAGAPEPPPLEGDWSPASGYAAGRRLAETPNVTAVFVANDEMAIGVIRALAEAGLSVPGDVSIVGVDDIPSAAYLSPPLTTITQDFDAVATQGVMGLIREIEAPGEEPPDVVSVPVRLIQRRSTSVPAPLRTR